MVRGGGLTLIELKKDSQTKQNKGRVKYGDYALHFGGLVDDEQLEDGAGQREKGGPRSIQDLLGQHSPVIATLLEESGSVDIASPRSSRKSSPNSRKGGGGPVQQKISSPLHSPFGKHSRVNEAKHGSAHTLMPDDYAPDDVAFLSTPGGLHGPIVERPPPLAFQPPLARSRRGSIVRRNSSSPMMERTGSSRLPIRTASVTMNRTVSSASRTTAGGGIRFRDDPDLSFIVGDEIERGGSAERVGELRDVVEDATQSLRAIALQSDNTMASIHRGDYHQASRPKMLETPRLLGKLQTVREAYLHMQSLQSETARVSNLVGGAAPTFRTPVLVRVCTLDDPTLRPIITPAQGSSDLKSFLRSAGKVLGGIEPVCAWVITRLLNERKLDKLDNEEEEEEDGGGGGGGAAASEVNSVEEVLQKLRKDWGNEMPQDLRVTDLGHLSRGDVVLMEENAELDLDKGRRPFDLAALKAEIPRLEGQFIRQTFGGDEDDDVQGGNMPQVSGLKFINVLGKGVRGFCFLATNDIGEQVVLKEYASDRDMGNESMNKAITSQIRSSKPHPNIERVIDFFSGPSSVHGHLSCFVLMHYLPRQSVGDEIERFKQKGGDGSLPTTTCTSYMIDLITGLEFLHHELRMAHGGVKLTNLLLEEPVEGRGGAAEGGGGGGGEGGEGEARCCTVKIAHMGLGDKVPSVSKNGRAYRCAESIESGLMTPADDMFAAGCCLSAMVTGVNIRERIQVGIFGLTQTAIDKNHQQVSAVDAVLGRLVKCLTGRQSQRMSADTALSVLKSAYDPAAASNIVKTHMMREAVPSALSTIDDHVAALRVAGPDTAETVLRRLVATCNDAQSCAQIVAVGGIAPLSDLLKGSTARVRELACVMLGRVSSHDHSCKTALNSLRVIHTLTMALASDETTPIMMQTVLETLSVLCDGHKQNCEDVAFFGGMEIIRVLMREGTPKTRIHAAKILHSASLIRLSKAPEKMARPRSSLVPEASIVSSGGGGESRAATEPGSGRGARGKGSMGKGKGSSSPNFGGNGRQRVSFGGGGGKGPQTPRAGLMVDPSLPTPWQPPTPTRTPRLTATKGNSCSSSPCPSFPRPTTAPVSRPRGQQVLSARASPSLRTPAGSSREQVMRASTSGASPSPRPPTAGSSREQVMRAGSPREQAMRASRPPSDGSFREGVDSPASGRPASGAGSALKSLIYGGRDAGGQQPSPLSSRRIRLSLHLGDEPTREGGGSEPPTRDGEGSESLVSAAVDAGEGGAGAAPAAVGEHDTDAEVVGGLEGEAEGGTGGVGEEGRVEGDSEGHDGCAEQGKQFLTFRERVNLLKPSLRAAGLAINPVASKSAKAVNERARAAKIIREGIIASESFQVLFDGDFDSGQMNRFIDSIVSDMTLFQLEKGQMLPSGKLDENGDATDDLALCTVKSGVLQVSINDTVSKGQVGFFSCEHIMRTTSSYTTVEALVDAEAWVISRARLGEILSQCGELGIAMKREVEAREYAGKEQRLKILKRLVTLSEKHLRNTVKAHAFGEASDSELDQASLEADLLSREFHDLKIVMSRSGQNDSSSAQSGHGGRTREGASSRNASTSRGGGRGSPTASLRGGHSRPSSPSVAVSLTAEDVCVAVTSREGDAELDAAISALSGPSGKWEHAAKLVRDICIGSASAKAFVGRQGGLSALTNVLIKGTGACLAPTAEAVGVACQGVPSNKKLFAEAGGIRPLISLLAPQVATEVITTSFIEQAASTMCSGPGGGSSRDWESGMASELKAKYGAVKESRISKLQSEAEAEFRSLLATFYVDQSKKESMMETIPRVAASMYRHTVRAITLQETAAKSLWICCRGESPNEAFVRFTLGKSAGIEPLLIVAKTGSEKGREYAMACLASSCQGNPANRHIFLIEGGVRIATSLLDFPSTAARRYAAEAVRAVCEDSSGRGGGGGGGGGGAGVQGVVDVCKTFHEAGAIPLLVEVTRCAREPEGLEGATEACLALRNMFRVYPVSRDAAGEAGLMTALTDIITLREPKSLAAALACVSAALLGGNSASENNAARLCKSGGMHALGDALGVESESSRLDACESIRLACESDGGCATSFGSRGRRSLGLLAERGMEGGSGSAAQRALEMLRERDLEAKALNRGRARIPAQ